MDKVRHIEPYLAATQDVAEQFRLPELLCMERRIPRQRGASS